MNPTPPEAANHHREFLLVLIMLATLTVLVIAVLYSRDESLKDLTSAKPTIEEIQVLRRESMNYRKDIISILLTAFGAWVGAGAAYFFGRENMREATRGYLQMANASAAERLEATKVQDADPRSIDWKVTTTDALKTVVDKLKEENERWFVPIVDGAGVLVDLIHKDAIFRYLLKDTASVNERYTTHTVNDVLAYLNEPANAAVKAKFSGIYVPVSLTTSLKQANDDMQAKHVFLAVVTDGDNKPIKYVDTADVRRVLLRA